MAKIKYIATPDSVNEDITIGDLVFERNGDSVEVSEDHPEYKMLIANPTFEVEGAEEEDPKSDEHKELAKTIAKKPRARKAKAEPKGE
jgi:hypothetical protein